MVVRLVYRVTCSILRMAAGRHRRAFDREVELVVLRHQVRILRRQVKRPNYTWGDRAFLAALSRLLPRDCWNTFGLHPKTLVGWHRELVRWRHRRRSRRGRPPKHRSVVTLVIRLARENSNWGYRRICGEMKKLGTFVSPTTVRDILIQKGLRPAPRRGGPSWAEFLAAEAKAILACDFFTVETAFLRTYYVFYFIEHQSRRVHIAGVTKNPTGEWVAQRARDLVNFSDFISPWHSVLIRDRDSKFTGVFDAVFASEGVRVIKTPKRAPRANAIAERWVRTVRGELFDWVIPLGRRHIEDLATEFVEHYNLERPHRALALVPPESDGLPEAGDGPVELSMVRRRDRFGGLVHEYELAA